MAKTDGAGPPVLSRMIRALRKRHGLTQEELAARARVSRVDVVCWERGRLLLESTAMKAAIGLGYPNVLAFLRAGVEALGSDIDCPSGERKTVATRWKKG